MILDLNSHFSFGEGIPATQKKRPRDADGNEHVNPFAKKHQARLAFAEHYRLQNAKYRKSCPHCRTLVKPALLHQHYDAYHPTIPFPSR